MPEKVNFTHNIMLWSTSLTELPEPDSTASYNLIDSQSIKKTNVRFFIVDTFSFYMVPTMKILVCIKHVPDLENPIWCSIRLKNITIHGINQP